MRDGEVDLYSINIPLIEGLLSEEGLKVCSTSIWRNTYGRLFKNVSAEHTPDQKRSDAIVTSGERQGVALTTASGPPPIETSDLLFKWAPEMKSLIAPPSSLLPVGSDGWAIHQGYVSVTPLRASFGEPYTHASVNVEDRIWKMRL